MPEQDSWLYKGKDGQEIQSLTCSALNAGVFRAAGLFDGLEVNVTEFTPRDVFDLAFYDKEIERP